MEPRFRILPRRSELHELHAYYTLAASNPEWGQSQDQVCNPGTGCKFCGCQGNPDTSGESLHQPSGLRARSACQKFLCAQKGMLGAQVLSLEKEMSFLCNAVSQHFGHSIPKQTSWPLWPGSAPIHHKLQCKFRNETLATGPNSRAACRQAGTGCL